MKSKKIVSLLLAGTMTAALLAAPAQAAEAQPIRVSSYKGSTLEVGERSGLIIGPSGTEYTVVSSAPDIVAVEQVLTFWVAIAKAEGTAKIITTTPDRQTGGMTISVKSAESSKADETEDTSSDAYSELRLELIRLINEARTTNGVSELPVNDALMTAAQTCSDRRYTWHHAPEEGQAAADTGYPYGFGDNLTVFTGTENAAQHPRPPGHHAGPELRLHRRGRDPARWRDLLLYVRLNPQQRELLRIIEPQTEYQPGTAFQRKLEGRSPVKKERKRV